MHKRKVNFALYFIFLITFGPAMSNANLMTQLKNFNISRDGLWKSTTVVLSGPGAGGKPIEQKACVNASDSKTLTDRMKGMDGADKNCRSVVVEDTKDSAKTEQNCHIGPAATKMVMIWKRTGENSYVVAQDYSNNGKSISKTKTTSTYVGPCTEKDKPSTAENSPEVKKHCADCKANVTKMKSECASKAGKEKEMCTMMLPQIENMCKMSCG